MLIFSTHANGLVVEHILAKDKVRVRFPVSVWLLFLFSFNKLIKWLESANKFNGKVYKNE